MEWYIVFIIVVAAIICTSCTISCCFIGCLYCDDKWNQRQKIHPKQDLESGRINQKTEPNNSNGLMQKAIKLATDKKYGTVMLSSNTTEKVKFKKIAYKLALL